MQVFFYSDFHRATSAEEEEEEDLETEAPKLNKHKHNSLQCLAQNLAHKCPSHFFHTQQVLMYRNATEGGGRVMK